MTRRVVVLSGWWLGRCLVLLALVTLLPSSLAATDEERPLGCRHPDAAGANGALHRSPTVKEWALQGDRRQMVILVDFNDCKFQAQDPLAYWNRVFNEEHLQEEPYHGSVHDYFYDQSYGQFRVTFDLYHVSLDKSYALYGSQDRNAGGLLINLVRTLDDRGCIWDYYDWDHDRYVDQIIVIFAGKGRNDGGNNATIWPHQWSLSGMGGQPHDVQSTATGYWFKVDNYCCIQELDGRGGYGTFGTICHEYSHCFGLPDFYYDRSVSTVGAWDLMDSGNNNGGGYCPPGYSAHERWLLGWLTPTELDRPASLTGIGALADGSQAFIIRHSDHPDEYYMVENRQQRGWDAHLPANGVLVFHIDYSKEVWDSKNPNTAERLRYSIFAANGDNRIERQADWPYPYGQNDSLNSFSSPYARVYNAHLNGSMLMNKPLTRILVRDGLASFDFMGGSATAILQPEASKQFNGDSWRVLYRSGPLTIVRDGQGRTRKIINSNRHAY